MSLAHASSPQLWLSICLRYRGPVMTDPASRPPASESRVDSCHASSPGSHGDDPMRDISSSRHGTHLAVSVPCLPRCVWCGTGTGFYCEGWRLPINRPYDTWRCVNPSARSRAQDMDFGWGCGEPVCTQCDRAFSCCMKCYCYKGDMNAEQAKLNHSELLQTHQGAGNTLFD